MLPPHDHSTNLRRMTLNHNFLIGHVYAPLRFSTQIAANRAKQCGTSASSQRAPNEPANHIDQPTRLGLSHGAFHTKHLCTVVHGREGICGGYDAVGLVPKLAIDARKAAWLPLMSINCMAFTTCKQTPRLPFHGQASSRDWAAAPATHPGSEPCQDKIR